MSPKIIISNSGPVLRAELDRYVNVATVEAEYGDDVVEGKGWPTLAHHGDRAGNPAPCLGPNLAERPFCPLGTPPEFGGHCLETFEAGYCQQECNRGPDVIGVSHFDLDTLGGVMRLAGRKSMNSDGSEPLFWEVAAEVDVRGPHKLNEIVAKYSGVVAPPELEEAIARLNAFWAWSEGNRLFPPRDGSVEDVSAFFERAMVVVDLIMDDDPAMIAAGKSWAEAKVKLNRASFRQAYPFDTPNGCVLLRESEQFVNHLYEHPHPHMGTFKAVVGFNPGRESITISLADPITGFSVAEFVQDLWGPEAGGRDVIGGSPRGRKMTMTDAVEAAYKFQDTLERRKGMTKVKFLRSEAIGMIADLETRLRKFTTAELEVVTARLVDLRLELAELKRGE